MTLEAIICNLRRQSFRRCLHFKLFGGSASDCSWRALLPRTYECDFGFARKEARELRRQVSGERGLIRLGSLARTRFCCVRIWQKCAERANWQIVSPKASLQFSARKVRGSPKASAEASTIDGSIWVAVECWKVKSNFFALRISRRRTVAKRQTPRRFEGVFRAPQNKLECKLQFIKRIWLRMSHSLQIDAQKSQAQNAKQWNKFNFAD